MVTFWDIPWTLRQQDPPLFSEYTQQNQLLQWHTGAMVFHPVRVGTLHTGHIRAKIQSHACVTCNINKYTYGSQEALVGKQKKSSLNTSEPQHLAGISAVSVPLIQTVRGTLWSISRVAAQTCSELHMEGRDLSPALTQLTHSSPKLRFSPQAWCRNRVLLHDLK